MNVGHNKGGLPISFPGMGGPLFKLKGVGWNEFETTTKYEFGGIETNYFIDITQKFGSGGHMDFNPNLKIEGSKTDVSVLTQVNSTHVINADINLTILERYAENYLKEKFGSKAAKIHITTGVVGNLDDFGGTMEPSGLMITFEMDFGAFADMMKSSYEGTKSFFKGLGGKD
jgi:hypothetical protein